jgi:hypothetical protein
MYFLHMYEHGTFKPAEITIRGDKGMKENNGGDE